ncbi:MAG: GNAT family N-acetyltransferase [Parcubacteria group bacterium]|nr:GNAT family N-acetyltransferase [Parcubacteria group bacterium]
MPNINLRKADASDTKFLWELRCQPEVFQYFRTPEPVEWESHIKWIDPVLEGKTNKELFIIQAEEERVGQVRFDYEENEAEVSISIIKEFWGKGIGSLALELAIKQAQKNEKITTLLAEIHKNNLASQRLFKKFSFELKEQKDQWLNYTLQV